MKIKKLEVENFMGYYGVNTFEMGNINVLCSQNGTGKTSFLEALRYALTGAEPDREIISNGCAQATVSITLDDGNVYTREKRVDKPNRCKINGKTTTAASMNEAIETCCGVKMEDIKIATSSDVIASLKPEELGHFLTSYIPEKLNLAKVESYIPDLTPEMDTLLAGYFPEEFTMDDINGAYDFFFSQRKVLKQMRQEIEAKLKGMPEEAPITDKESLKKQLETFTNIASQKKLYEEKLSAYNRAVAAKQRQEASITKMENEAAAISATKKTDSERDAKKKELNELKNKGNEHVRVITTLKANYKLLETSLENLMKPVCPLSDSLVCATDKSKIKEELEVNLKDTDESIKVQKAAIDKLRKECADKEAELTAYEKEKADYDKKCYILRQVEEMKKSVIEIPAKPEEPEIPVGINEAGIKASLAAWDEWEKAKELRKKLDSTAAQEKDNDRIVKAFAEKGTVKVGITEYYLKVFSTKLNEKAALLRPGLSYMLKAENGVKVYCDLDGSGTYLPFKSLSGGEKMNMVYIIMDLINELSGMKLVFLDELSVLDENSLDSLMNLLIKHKDEYDHVFLAMVDHKDVLTTLDKYSGDFTKLGMTA